MSGQIDLFTMILIFCGLMGGYIAYRKPETREPMMVAIAVVTLISVLHQPSSAQNSPETPTGPSPTCPHGAEVRPSHSLIGTVPEFLRGPNPACSECLPCTK